MRIYKKKILAGATLAVSAGPPGIGGQWGFPGSLVHPAGSSCPALPPAKGRIFGAKNWVFWSSMNVLTTGKERGCVLLFIIIFNGNFFK